MTYLGAGLAERVEGISVHLSMLPNAPKRLKPGERNTDAERGAGASAVSVGTAVFGDPSAPVRILRELEQALDERGFSSVRDVIGLAHLPRPERAPGVATVLR